MAPLLPLPGTPAASWARFRSRLGAAFSGADPRVCAAFWTFGLINNVLYVMILVAALDLVGPAVPKGAVLLADITPSLITKMFAPYFIHAIPYRVRVPILVTLSTTGMLLIALSPANTERSSIMSKMVGIMLSSLSSGAGELSFLGLTHFYGSFSIAAWGSGTGASGLVGAGMYTLATTSLGFSVRGTLLVSAMWPAVMIFAFFFVLPQGPLLLAQSRAGYERVARKDSVSIEKGDRDGDEGLLEKSSSFGPGKDAVPARIQRRENEGWNRFKSNLRRAKSLFIPFMVPLLLVYIAEYTINQGVAPTLLFPLHETPFSHFRSFYPAYNGIYQIGVFVSRSSTPFFRIRSLYKPSLLQVLNLFILTLHSLFNFIPNVYIIFLIIFWEGLLGGVVYVSTFAEISERVPKEDREFSLGATTVSDAAGICAAGFFGMAFEVWLCDWQVGHGRKFCTQL